MIKNRRTLILSNPILDDANSDAERLANELHSLGNEVFYLAGISNTTNLSSRIVFEEIKPKFTLLQIEIGFIDAILKLLGKSNVVERLASEAVFELGKLFDVVLSFEAAEFQNLSIFYAKVNLLVIKSDAQSDFINSSVDHVIVLNRDAISAEEIWNRISSQNSRYGSKKSLEQAS